MAAHEAPPFFTASPLWVAPGRWYQLMGATQCCGYKSASIAGAFAMRMASAPLSGRYFLA